MTQANLLKRHIEHSVYGALMAYRDICEDYNVDAFEENFNFYVVKFPWSRPVKASIKEELDARGELEKWKRDHEERCREEVMRLAGQA